MYECKAAEMAEWRGGGLKFDDALTVKDLDDSEYQIASSNDKLEPLQRIK